MSLEAQEVAVRVRLLGGTAFETEANAAADSVRNIGRAGKEADAELAGSGGAGAAGFLGGASKAVDTLNGKLDTFAKKAHNIGRQTAALSLGAGFLIYEGIKEHSESEAAFTRLETLARLTHQQREAVERLAPAYKMYGASVKNVAEEIYPIFSDFKNIPKSLEVLKASLEGARVGHASKADTAWILSSFTKAGFKDVKGGPKEIMSLILQATQEGKMVLPSLIAAARSSFFPLIQATHMSLRDALSALGAASRVGNEPDVYATLLRTAIVKAQAIKGGALVDAKKLGFSGGQPELNLLTKTEGGWIKLLQRINTAYDKAGPQGSKARAEAEGWAANMFGGSRSFGTIATQLATLKSQEEIHKNLNKTHGSSLMEQMFGTSSKTVSAQLEDLGAAVHNFLNSLGGSFAPGVLSMLKDTVSVLGEVVKGFNGLPAPVKSVITGVLVLSALLSPAAFLLGGLARGFMLVLFPLKALAQLASFAKWASMGSELGIIGTGLPAAAAGLGVFGAALFALSLLLEKGKHPFNAFEEAATAVFGGHTAKEKEEAGEAKKEQLQFLHNLHAKEAAHLRSLNAEHMHPWARHIRNPADRRAVEALERQEPGRVKAGLPPIEVTVHSHVHLDGKKIGENKNVVLGVEKKQREHNNRR